MFCIECGQAMADEAKFCAYCGTRRAVPRQSGEVSGNQVCPDKPAERQVVVPPPAPAVRLTRSTAEIMPVPISRPVTALPATPQRIPAEAAAPAEAARPMAADQNRVAPPVQRYEPPVAMEAPAVDDGVEWTTSAPVPSDAYPQGGLYRDDEPAIQVMAPQPARPAPASARPGTVPYASVPFAGADYSPDTAPARRRISPVLIGAFLVAIIAIAGIVWMLRSSMSGSGKVASKVEITMFPTTAKVVAGKGIDVAATVTGAPTSEVTWSVEEGADTGQIQTRGAYAKEGAISLYATYTPKAAGTYHLVATSTADPSKSASAEITAVAK